METGSGAYFLAIEKLKVRISFKLEKITNNCRKITCKTCDNSIRQTIRTFSTATKNSL